MVGVLFVCGVATVVAGDVQNVIVFEQFYKFPHFNVYFFQRLGISVHVTAMSVLHVGVHKVYKYKSVKIFLCNFQRLVESVKIACGVQTASNALSVENILDFSHGNAFHSCVFDKIQQRFCGRIDGKIFSVRRAYKRIFPRERTCNHSAHAVLAHAQFACLFAHVVQLFQRVLVHVHGNLQNAVRRRVHDGIACGKMLCTVVLYYLCSAVRLVAQNFASQFLFQTCYKFLGETVGEGRQRGGSYYSCHFPMPHRRVLSFGKFFQTGKSRIGLTVFTVSAVYAIQPHFLHVGNVQIVCVANVFKRVCAVVAKFFTIGHCPDTESVNNQNKGSHILPLCVIIANNFTFNNQIKVVRTRNKAKITSNLTQTPHTCNTIMFLPSLTACKKSETSQH